MSRTKISLVAISLALLALFSPLPLLASLLHWKPDLPDGTKVARNLGYGADPAQVLDVYQLPRIAGPKPVIVMVHGGAWAFGSKDYKGVVEAKVAHWLPRGVVFVSVEYRLLPEQDVSGQADDVARALAFVQRHAAEWGGDPRRVSLMGHSAGAHLVSLLSADPSRAQALGARRWAATVALDSAAFDVASIMERPHLRLYDRAFGTDPAQWRRLSPLYALQPQAVPVLVVCSAQRRDEPCAQGRAYTAAARALGVAGEVLPQDMDHGEINRELGAEENYTAAVDRFLAAHGAR